VTDRRPANSRFTDLPAASEGVRFRQDRRRQSSRIVARNWFADASPQAGFDFPQAAREIASARPCFARILA
jgi:hypothetical protein